MIGLDDTYTYIFLGTVCQDNVMEDEYGGDKF